jgi:hypothetical protein
MSGTIKVWSAFEDAYLLRSAEMLPIEHVALRLSVSTEEATERLQYLRDVQEPVKTDGSTPATVAQRNDHPDSARMDALQSAFLDVCELYSALGGKLETISEILSRNTPLDHLLEESANIEMFRRSIVEPEGDAQSVRRFLVTQLHQRYIFVPRPFTIETPANAIPEINETA